MFVVLYVVGVRMAYRRGILRKNSRYQKVTQHCFLLLFVRHMVMAVGYKFELVWPLCAMKCSELILSIMRDQSGVDAHAGSLLQLFCSTQRRYHGLDYWYDSRQPVVVPVGKDH